MPHSRPCFLAEEFLLGLGSLCLPPRSRALLTHARPIDEASSLVHQALAAGTPPPCIHVLAHGGTMAMISSYLIAVD